MKNDKVSPVYPHSYEIAVKKREVDAYMQSLDSNMACATAIEKAIGSCYQDYSLDTAKVLREVEKRFSRERIEYVLANTLQFKSWDGRISPSNKHWAKTIKIEENLDSYGKDLNRQFIVDQAHPGLIDLLVSRFRREEKPEA